MSDVDRLRRNLRKLVGPGETRKTLESVGAAVGIPDGVGAARPKLTGSGSVASGIASPLTETSRTYHTTKAISSDGLFTWSVPHRIFFDDARGAAVEIVYLAPTS